ncbi:MAG: hypothetical protein BMS9Abin29_1346 [Gemmatimonadota bacterium]|nr:MAG: hypothetical protein BMS9Abin29_1346 [Gemmatimonadota bacterium]
MIIVRVELLRRKRERVLLHLDSGEPVELALEVLERRGLGPGDAVASRTLRTLVEQDAKWRVRQAALHLLSYRIRGTEELRRRLGQKGFRAPLIKQCLETLSEHGLLDDRAFAASYARSHISARPRGPFRIEQELRKKGVAPEVAHDAVEGVLEAEGITESALARKALEKWIRSQSLDTLNALVSPPPSPVREKVRRRLYGFLTRRGFSPGTTRAAVDEAGALIRQA